MAGSRKVRRCPTKVRGVTLENADSSSRQRIIENCRQAELLQSIPDRQNCYDSNAVKVCQPNGE